MAEEFKTIKKSQDFCKWLMDHTDKFPRSRRFSMAVRLENIFLDFLEEISLANRRREKLPLLHDADELLFRTRLLVRMSHEMKLINTNLLFRESPARSASGGARQAVRAAHARLL